jgi:hypothetical protein
MDSAANFARGESGAIRISKKAATESLRWHEPPERIARRRRDPAGGKLRTPTPDAKALLAS